MSFRRYARMRLRQNGLDDLLARVIAPKVGVRRGCAITIRSGLAPRIALSCNKYRGGLLTAHFPLFRYRWLAFKECRAEFSGGWVTGNVD